jgi:hypothetical protein
MILTGETLIILCHQSQHSDPVVIQLLCGWYLKTIYNGFNRQPPLKGLDESWSYYGDPVVSPKAV